MSTYAEASQPNGSPVYNPLSARLSTTVSHIDKVDDHLRRAVRSVDSYQDRTKDLIVQAHRSAYIAQQSIRWCDWLLSEDPSDDSTSYGVLQSVVQDTAQNLQKVKRDLTAVDPTQASQLDRELAHSLARAQIDLTSAINSLFKVQDHLDAINGTQHSLDHLKDRLTGQVESHIQKYLKSENLEDTVISLMRLSQDMVNEYWDKRSNLPMGEWTDRFKLINMVLSNEAAGCLDKSAVEARTKVKTWWDPHLAHLLSETKDLSAPSEIAVWLHPDEFGHAIPVPTDNVALVRTALKETMLSSS
ncbi:MAG: hypothetical protein TREMPRED_005053 [Tremellales sp. Tagirdzhanova-0007]|nr:MAG: hypothetical protein TREMPRED_005053 [Tremellales sp. Tagirdzhanova-0007]